MKIATQVGVFVLALLGGCTPDDKVEVPNQSLDRPMDAVLSCIKIDSGTFQPISLDQCENEGSEVSCTTPNQLIGFIANSERNEIALFRRCERFSVVDLDKETPGYQFLPAGGLPQSLTASGDSCRVISANSQSCDFSVVNVPAAASLAFAVSPDIAAGSVVSHIVPQTSQGRPLASRPAEIIGVPGRFRTSSEVRVADSPPTSGNPRMAAADTESGTGTGDGEDTDTGYEPGDPFADFCPADAVRTVYATFPSCQLVAEVDVVTGEIVQSRQFVRGEDGTISVVDTGSDPPCPVDCPNQAVAGDPTVDADPEGLHPIALELVIRPEPRDDSSLTPAEEEFISRGYDALFVGGPGSPHIFEIPLDEQGRFARPDQIIRLALEDPEGVHRIRVTPPMDLEDFGAAAEAVYQFIYVIAGDGSTHVVKRSISELDEVGVECDTQVDTTLIPATPCYEIDPGFPDASVRRPLATGPGIRAPGGATINDWTFLRIDGDTVDSEDPEEPALSPTARAGILGVAVTSLGEVALSVFGQFNRTMLLAGIEDPAGLLRADIYPHMFWPFLSASNPFGHVPLVADRAPERALSETMPPTSVLAPSLRRIDLAYSARNADDMVPQSISPEQQRIAAALGDPTNADRMGTFGSKEEGDGLYEERVVRAVVRDYRRWTQQEQEWTLAWEGVIPGTASSTGRFECDLPGWPEGVDLDGEGGEPPLKGGTCLVPPEHYVRAKDGGGSCSQADPSCPSGFECDESLTRCIRTCAQDTDCIETNDAGEPVDSEGEPTDDPSEMVPDPDQTCSTDPAFPGCRLRDEARARSSRLVDEGASFCDQGVLAGDKLDLARCAEDSDCGTGQRCLTDPSSVGSTGICISAAQYEADRGRLREVCAPFLEDPCGEVRRSYLITRAFQEELWLQALDIKPRSYLVPVDDIPPIDVPDPAGDGTLEFAPVEEHVEKLSCLLPNDRNGDPLEQPEGGCEDDAGCVTHTGNDAYVCIDGLCRAPCEVVTELIGRDACRQTPLPGPACFQELTNYAVRLNNSFLIGGDPVGSFFSDRVRANPDSQECAVEPTVSTLLTSRLWLGANESETFNHPVWGIPACVSLQPTPFDPNPCRIVVPRSENNEASTFHTFRYHDQNVSAIRFSNPFMSIVIDLTSLLGLASESSREEGAYWRPDVYCVGGSDPECSDGQQRAFHRFERARIPDGYRETFVTQPGTGYRPTSTIPVQGTSTSAPLTYPVRVIPAPEEGWVFIVDAGGRGGLTGIRGQVQRVRVGYQPQADPHMEVR